MSTDPQRIGTDKSITDLYDRVRALERRPSGTDDVDFQSRFVDIYNQAVDVPLAGTVVEVDWSQHSLTGNNELITNDAGSLVTIDPIVGTEIYDGEIFAWDFGAEPTRITIKETGTYICEIGARFYAAGATEPTLPFTARIITGSGQLFWGAGIAGPATQTYFADPGSFISDMNHVTPFTFTPSGLSTPWWRAARIVHNSTEVVSAVVEMFIVRVAPVV